MNYIQNPHRRCQFCFGREILVVDGDTVLDSNLIQEKYQFRCKNLKECEENQNAEMTRVDFTIDEEGNPDEFIYSLNGKPIVEVRKK